MMINVVDIIVILALLYAILVGWQKGIVRLFVNFLAFFLASAIAGFYFNKTYQTVHSLAVFIIGTIILSVLLSKALSLWNKKICEKAPPCLLSRLLGGSVLALWAGSFALLILFALSIIPDRVTNLRKIKNSVVASSSFALINQHLLKKAPLFEQLTTLLSLPQDDDQLLKAQTESLEKIASLEEFQVIQKNKAVQNILEDKELMDDIQQKDLTKIIQNPKIQNLLQDKKLMEDLKEFYFRFLKENPNQGSSF